MIELVELKEFQRNIFFVSFRSLRWGSPPKRGFESIYSLPSDNFYKILKYLKFLRFSSAEALKAPFNNNDFIPIAHKNIFKLYKLELLREGVFRT